MQFTTLATLFSLAAFAAATPPSPLPTGCVNGRYYCGSHNGSHAIYVCNASYLVLTATCVRNCEYINGIPYCT
ncbi:hypothetical protein VTJ83DRAFT_2923 [Remersonia thermophila]|uniref:Chitin-binding type-2 domain-containing protein n=1 Tax=Remersonia thermophila TaxID=72144 RepID=A0ABR4DCR0_9PEZI